jgi:hypothetical protein
LEAVLRRDIFYPTDDAVEALCDSKSPQPRAFLLADELIVFDRNVPALATKTVRQRFSDWFSYSNPLPPV